MKQVKSGSPEKRFQALDQLNQYKQTENLEIQVDVLTDMVKLAAGHFPDPVDRWDVPSYYLVDFVCDFPMEEIVKAIFKHFDGFHPWAKERAIEFLLHTEDEGVFHELEEKIVDLMLNGEIDLPIETLTSYPVFSRDILDKTLECIHSTHYKYYIYDLLLAVNSYQPGYRMEEVLPILMADYGRIKEQYLKYDAEYKDEYVYKSWKDSYFSIRAKMVIFIRLMDCYFKESTTSEIKLALSFQDPVLKTEALLVCIEKAVPFEPFILTQCAEKLESAEMVYWELKNRNKEHLYPVKEGKQKLLAKSRMYLHIVHLPEEEEGQAHFPENIQIEHEFETDNLYGQPLRYYLMSFLDGGTKYAGFAGGYALEEGDDTAYMWDGTYTDFVEFDSKSIDGHISAFFADREESKQNYEQYIHYESKPKVSKGMWFLYGLVIWQWSNALIKGIAEYAMIPIPLTILAIILTVFQQRKIKRSKVSIVGRKLIVNNGNKEKEIALEDIKKVEYTKKQILVYNKENKAEMAFPFSWVSYPLFYHHMVEQTAHLRERPFIQD